MSLVAEGAGLAGIDLQQSVGRPAGQEDGHVHQGLDAVLLHELGEGEPLLLVDVLGDDGLPELDGVGLRRVLAQGKALVTDDAGAPANAV